VRRLAAALGVGLVPAPDSGSKLPHSIRWRVEKAVRRHPTRGAGVARDARFVV